MNVYFEAAYVCPFVDGCSELQMLKDCLIQGNSIKVLHLAFEDVEKSLHWQTLQSLSLDSWEDGPLNFHWQDGDRFPALEEWRWTGRTEYIYSTHQMEMWQQCMDWTQLRTLDFGFQPITTMLPFKTLAGNVPQLNSLTVAISHFHDPDLQDPLCVVPIFGDFLSSIVALQILRLDWAFISESLPVVLHHQGPHLRELGICYVNQSNSWDRDQCIDVLTKAPQLCHLRIQTNKAPNPTVDLQGKWHALCLSPLEKWQRMKDVNIERREQQERKHALVMKRLRDCGELPGRPIERTPRDIAKTLE
jgi:hypothetical protein